ncbi:MAG: SDR family NAD(P)-dependent oxidoreductase [Verrucomicrobiota bacterium]
MTNAPPLAHRKALVTGASSGIGRAIARELSRQGCSLALLARRRDRLDALSMELSDSSPAVATVPVDLTQYEDTTIAISQAAEELGGLDILINAAGVGLQASLIDGEFEKWKTMMEVNVLALSLVTREALRHFPDSGGHIVNLSSMSGHRVPGKGGFYAPTKFAVRAITEGLRQELRARGNQTRVSSISPGFVDTELLDAYFQTEGDDDSKYERIGYPILKPEEVAEMVLHQLTLPPTVEVTDILMRPTAQAT